MVAFWCSTLLASAVRSGVSGSKSSETLMSGPWGRPVHDRFNRRQLKKRRRRFLINVLRKNHLYSISSSTPYARRSTRFAASASWLDRLALALDRSWSCLIAAFNDGAERLGQRKLLPAVKVLAISLNWSSAAWRSSTISAAITSGAGRLSVSSKDSSRSQKMSRDALSRATSSS